MAVLCLLCVSFLSSLSPCSSQLGSFASVCVVSLPWGCKIPSHFCSPGTGSDLFSFFLCSNSDLWISTCFFSLALAHLPFFRQLLMYLHLWSWQPSGWGTEAVGAWPPLWVEWDKQAGQCLSALLLPGLWGWECKEKCRITNLYLKGSALPLKGLACSLGNLSKTKKQWLWW